MTCLSFLFVEGRGLKTRGHELGDELSRVHDVILYSYKELGTATNDFSPSNKIGEGGFGCVYKGKLRKGHMAAIKVLSSESRQGVSKFLAEIKVEVAAAFISAGVLELKFASELPEDLPIFMRRGYLAREYAIRGQLKSKSDVYSGVVLIEIVSGRCNTNTRLPPEEQYILERAWQLNERNKLVTLVDTSLNGYFDAEQACRFLKIGLLSTQDSTKLRPLMSTVVRILTGEKKVPDKITKPGLISDFMALKVRSNPKPKAHVDHVCSTYNSSGSDTTGNLTFTSAPSSQATMSFTAVYDRSN